MEIREMGEQEKGRCDDARKIKWCGRCGREFVCGAADGEKGCWCASLPLIVPMSRDGCLCKSCLQTEVECLISQSQAEQAGLCATCRNARTLKTKSAANIILCEAAAADERLSKYPRLPMLSCPGHAPKPV